MPTIFADSTDGRVLNFRGSGASWSTARDGGTGTNASSTLTSTNNAAGVQGATSRGGYYVVVRSFFSFDVSGITSTVASATLNLRGFSTNSGDVIVVKASKPDGSNLTTADFDALPGFSAGNTMSGNVTDYSSEVTSWSTSGYNSITLNSTALSDLTSLNSFIVALVEFDHDYSNVAPAQDGTFYRVGLYYSDNSGTSFDPYIDYTLAPTGYANNVNGVSSANIGSVIGVATANIDKINGV